MKVNAKLLIYSGTHFLIDFACAYFIFTRFATFQHWTLCFVLYNFFAFAMQAPFGLLADRLNRNAVIAAAGCVITAFSICFSPYPVVGCVVIGIGNALFHIGGGIDILNQCETKCARLGIFVSPGAMGVFLGSLWARTLRIPHWLVCVILVAAAVLILLTQSVESRKEGKTDLFLSENRRFAFPSPWTSRILFTSLLLFTVVFIRAFVGNTLSFPWRAQPNLALLLTCGVVLGKTVGGFLADKMGSSRASLITLSIAAVLFLFADNPVAGIFAVFFFNMTMPITLWAIARIFPCAKGFSFGLLTASLFLGLLPVIVDAGLKGLPWAIYCALSVFSCVLLLFSLRNVNSR